MPPPKVDSEAPSRDEQEKNAASLGAKLQNPLLGFSREEVLADADAFVDTHGLAEFREEFQKGALLAQATNIPNGFENIALLTEVDKAILRREESNRWDQPFMLYFLCVLCAGSAIVQGMDQTAVNGAQVRHASCNVISFSSRLTNITGILL